MKILLNYSKMMKQTIIVVNMDFLEELKLLKS